MNQPEIELAAALRERLVIIADEMSRRDPAQHLARLQSISEKIAALGKTLPSPIEPRLAHYLERCSYDKALAELDARQQA